MSASVLALYLSGRPAGWLESDGEALTIRYSDSWRADPSGHPLSPPLGFHVDAGAVGWSQRCRRYLDNLLPEGRALEDLSVRNAVSKANLFALMRIVGRETAGAVALLPEGERPDSEGTRREVTTDELSERIRTRDELPFSVWDGRVRMSIAGQQDKVGVRLEGGRLFLVDGGLATTHILKPEPRRFPGLVVNEAFCLKLAAASGLDVAEATILRVPEPVLCVRRFDRRVEGGDVRRLHVIDGLQALDLAVGYKYERNLGSGKDVAHVRDGASIPRLHGVAERSVHAASDIKSMLDRHIFNFLVGNSDAHGKNFSFFVSGGGLSLAPAYDIVCVSAWSDRGHLDAELAFAIGDQFDADAVTLRDWAQLADDSVLPRAFVARACARMATKVRRALDVVGDDLADNESERDMLATIRGVIGRRLRQIGG
jgi:serine/threonine-protein kinase HipA